MTAHTHSEFVTAPVHLLSLAGIADFFNVGKRSVQRWRAQSDFPSPDFVRGKILRWKISTLEIWVNQRGSQK